MRAGACGKTVGHTRLRRVWASPPGVPGHTPLEHFG